MNRAVVAVVALAVGLAAAACGDDGDSGDGGPASIVVLGDSIASGEGIRYGFTYDRESGTWNGPRRPDPTWQGRYQDCHQSPRAYGDLVADELDAALTKLACSGASYANGITTAQTFDPPEDLGPAQFGTFPDGPVNRRYAAARPDVVLITLGADDVKFKDIVGSCVLEGAADPTFCTAANPGPAAEEARTELLPQLRQNYRALIRAIQEQGEDSGKIPRIVFTAYPDPLPPDDVSIEGCPDVVTLNRDQLDYISSLGDRVNHVIRRLGEIDGVEVADASDVYDGHEFCTDDPWAYGLSIAAKDPTNLAPLHPTPAGQRAIAEVVAPLVRG